MFTCFTVRTVHIEVVKRLDTNSVINALVRFVNKRGKPDHITNDCGTNSKEAVKELELGLGKVDKFAVRENMPWKFNPPASLHVVCVWKRNIRTVKDVMYKAVKNVVFTEYQL